MNKILPFAAIAAIVLSACASKENKASETATSDTTVETKNISGKWLIENVVLNDSTSAKPSEITPETPQYILFNDGQYMVQTNCNTIQGDYTTAGDSLKWGASLMTEMACENMQVEDLIRQILPNVTVTEFTNDSTLRLNTNSAEQYITLTKAPETAE